MKYTYCRRFPMRIAASVPRIALVLVLALVSATGLAGPLTKLGVMPTGPITWSSPTLADLDGNGNTLEIVVGDDNGVIWAYRSNRTLMWSYSIRNFPQPENQTVQTAVQSSPVVADIDNDGAMEVVVTLGDRENAFQPGRLFVIHLDAAGLNPQPGFFHIPYDRVEGANGVPDAFFASPTVADLNGDGTLEILAGCFDYILYAFDWQGNFFWQLDYDQEDSFERYLNTGDTIWGTPTVADIDNDGSMDILFGNSNGGDRFGFRQIPHAALNGGALLALNPNGTIKFGSFMWEHYTQEGADPLGDDHYCRVNPSVGIDSSPALADVDADGRLELLLGTGQYYGAPIPDARHRRIFCYNVEDDTPITAPTIEGVRKAPFWGTDVGNEVYISPACGQLDADPDLEVVVRTIEEVNPMVYVVKGSTGQILPGFPQLLTPGNGRQLGCAIADIDGDGHNDILMPSFRNLLVFGHDGSRKDMFGHDVAPADRPNNFIPAQFFTAPAVADADNDGNVEVFIPSGEGIYVYRGGQAGPIAWGQYRQNPRKTGYLPIRNSIAIDARAPATVSRSGSFPVTVSFRNDGSETWTPATFRIVRTRGSQAPAAIALPAGTAIETGERLDVTFAQTTPPLPGAYQLGWRMERIGAGAIGSEATVWFQFQPSFARNWLLYQ